MVVASANQTRFHLRAALLLFNFFQRREVIGSLQSSPDTDNICYCIFTEAETHTLFLPFNGGLCLTSFRGWNSWVVKWGGVKLCLRTPQKLLRQLTLLQDFKCTFTSGIIHADSPTLIWSSRLPALWFPTQYPHTAPYIYCSNCNYF